MQRSMKRLSKDDRPKGSKVATAPVEAKSLLPVIKKSIISGLLAAGLLLALIYFRTSSRPHAPQPPLSPSLNVESGTYAGVEMHWAQVSNPIGVLLLFHGCTHDGEDFFRLPEELKLVRSAVSLQLLPLALSSQQRTGSRCWETDFPKEWNADLQHVVDAVPEEQDWISSDIPLLAMGASSGGSFVTALAATPPLNEQLASVLVQISPGVPDALGSPLYKAATVFAVMPRDRHFASRSAALSAVDALALREVAASMYEYEPQPLHSRFFSDAIDGISVEVSTQMYSYAVGHGYLDADGFLEDNPRNSALLMEMFGTPRLGLDATFYYSVEEELNVAYAVHELSGEGAYDILRWMLAESGLE